MKKNVHSTMILAVLCATALAFMLMATGCGQSGSGGAASAGSSASAASGQGAEAGALKADAIGPYSSGKHHAVVTVEGYDPFTIELDADAAPASVVNFCTLANDGYYDGLTFYRFAEGFCMQGGTKGNSASGSDSTLDPVVGEFSANGYANTLADDFVKGTVAMARTSDPNSARSTFFVTLGSGPTVSASLNGQYAAFGIIDEEGMKTVDKIVEDYLPNVTDPRMGAIDDEENQAKIESIKIVD